MATRQAVFAVDHIEPGMTKIEVSEILGNPIAQHSTGDREAWEYCLVGFGANDYIVVVFEGIGVSNRVSVIDADWGLCRNRFQKFEWPAEASAGAAERA